MAHDGLARGALFTDHYQLSMAQLYFRMGLHELPARFEHVFRSYPDYGKHQAGYCINAGMASLLDWMSSVRFGDAEVEALASLTTSSGHRVFADDFLAWLGAAGGFDAVTLHAVPEGRVVHPEAPITVAEGPLAMAQILETPLLNHLNFPTLIATKASRVAEAARGGKVLEFGMRRAPAEGANAATRASLVGGADFSSNLGASYDAGIPSRGTHAHSMVQVFMALGEGELGAFQAYADVYPDDCLLLVDTIDTLESGVPNAIRVFETLRRSGHRPVGIRLDSGDLAYLAIQSARMLEAAGFDDTTIVLSSALDELAIWQILAQISEEAPRYGVDADRLISRLVYGVGTRMVTSDGDPSLDGVYKTTAVFHEGEWVPAVKVSDSPAKVINPGAKRLWRIYDERGTATADLMALEQEQPSAPLLLRHPSAPEMRRTLGPEQVSRTEPLLEPAWRDGQPLVDGDIEAARARRRADLERLDPGVRRLVNPHVYHVSLSEELWRLKQRLIEEATTR
jgi:nicotinate phosphoribosyltransferase